MTDERFEAPAAASGADDGVGLDPVAVREQHARRAETCDGRDDVERPRGGHSHAAILTPVSEPGWQTSDDSMTIGHAPRAALSRGRYRGKNARMENRDPDVDAWFETYDNPQKELVQSLTLTRA